MGFGLLGPIKLMSRSHDNKYILVVIDYVTKQVEAKAFKDQYGCNHNSIHL
jgi:hypothetical protein